MEQEQLVRNLVERVRTVATIGAKGEGAAAAHTVPQRMVEAGIRIIPVNPTIAQAFGEASRPTMAEVNEPIELVQVFRRSEFLAGIADEILALPEAHRPRAVWLQFGIHDAVAIAKLRASGIEVVEDRCFAIEMARFPRRND